MEGKRYKRSDELGSDTQGRRQKYADKEAHNSRRPGSDELVRGGEQKHRERIIQSAITVVKRVNPENPGLANFMTNMVMDFSDQRPEVPKHSPSARNHAPLQTINKDGKAAMGLPNTVIGAGEDDKGNY